MKNRVLKGTALALAVAASVLIFPGVYRPIFEAQIGGGFNDPLDGGSNLESDGDISSNGVADFSQYKQNSVVYDLSLIGSGGSAHIVQEEGVPLPQRAVMNFEGANVTAEDDEANDATKVTISASAGGVSGPVSSTEHAVPRYDDTTGAALDNSLVVIDDSGNVTTPGTVDGRNVSVDGTKLDGIEAGADDNPTDAEIATSYGNIVAIASQAEAEAGTSTDVKRWTPERIKQAIVELAPGGGGGSGDVVGPASSTDNAIPRYDGTTGKLLQGSGVTIDDSNNIVLDTSDTVDGRDVSVDGTKLDGIEAGADDNPTDAEIETSYNAQVAAASQAEMESGTEAAIRRMSPLRIKQAIDALGASGGDPTYGSDVAADDDAVYVDENNRMGLGIIDPLEEIHIYNTDGAPRLMLTKVGTGTPTDTGWISAGTVAHIAGAGPNWSNPTNAQGAPDGTAATIVLVDQELGDILRATNFPSFGIPDGATITGVETRFVYKNSNGNASEYLNQLVIAGTPSGNDNSVSDYIDFTATYVNRDRGGSSDLWGLSLTDDSFGSTFGFQVQIEDFDGAGVTFYIDAMQVKVHYTPSSEYIWSFGHDNSDNAFTVRAGGTDQLRLNYVDGSAEFPGVINADGYKQDGVLYDLSTFGTGAGDVVGPASATDNAIVRFDTLTGKLVQNSEVTIGDTGSITMGSGDTVDGRDLSVDGTKLDGIASGATANTGTVTSIAISGADGIDVDSGSPVTTSGTIQLGLDSTAIHWNMMVAGSTVTPTTSDSLLISDASNGGAVADISLANLFITATGNDNYLYKKNGSTGQFDLTGVLIDDSNNVTAGTYNGYTVPAGTGTFAGIATPQTLTNKDIQPRELVVSGGVTVDAGAYDRVVITGISSSPLTIGAPTGTFVNGKKLEFAINQGSIPSVFNFNAVFKASDEWGTVANAIPAVSTTNDAWDYYLFEWNDYEDEWHLQALSQGN